MGADRPPPFGQQGIGLSPRCGVRPPTQPDSPVGQPLLAQAEKAFERSSGSTRADKAQDQRIQRFEAKLSSKNEVIAELLEENVKSKKERGEL